MNANAGPSAAGSANAMVVNTTFGEAVDSASAWGRDPAAYHVAPGSHVCGWHLYVQHQMARGIHYSETGSIIRQKQSEFGQLGPVQKAPWKYEAFKSRRQALSQGAPVDQVLAAQEEPEEVGGPWCLATKSGNLRSVTGLYRAMPYRSGLATQH